MRYLEPREIALATQIARGDIPASGYVVLTKEEYFARPAGFCTHPAGYPCFKSCVRIVEPVNHREGAS